MIKFRSDIEGLRAVAIVPVVLFHASEGLAPGGYVGVDVFFVISGFLITRIILTEMNAGGFSFLSFYKRRVRRILPALFAVLLPISIASILILPPAALSEYAQTALATIFFVSNMVLLQFTGYFGGNVNLKPLLHMWSLAVEEQFYIFFPMLLLLVRNWFRARYLLTFVVCAVASLVLSLWMTNQYPEQSFFFGPARAFELLIGAMLALDLPSVSRRWAREAVAAGGFALIIYAICAFDRRTAFPGVAALIPCLGTALIIHAGRAGSSAVGKALSLPPVRYVGAVSYSLYLWHWPVLALARNYYLGELSPQRTACAVLLAFLLAAASRRFVELPALRSGKRDGSVFPAALIASGLFAALSLALMVSNGLPWRYSTQQLTLFQAAGDFNHRRPVCHGQATRFIPYSKSCTYGPSRSHADVAIWGDSQGVELAEELGALMPPGHSVVQITASACPPALGFSPRLRPLCSAHNQETLDHLVLDPAIQSVVLIAHYNEYDEDWSQFTAGFDQVVARLVAARKQVILVDPIPEFNYSVPIALGILAGGSSGAEYRITRAHYLDTNARSFAELSRVAGKYRIARVPTASILCDTQYCPGSRGTNILYFNENHLSSTGARIVAHAIVPLVTAVAAQ